MPCIFFAFTFCPSARHPLVGIFLIHWRLPRLKHLSPPAAPRHHGSPADTSVLPGFIAGLTDCTVNHVRAARPPESFVRPDGDRQTATFLPSSVLVLPALILVQAESLEGDSGAALDINVPVLSPSVYLRLAGFIAALAWHSYFSFTLLSCLYRIRFRRRPLKFCSTVTSSTKPWTPPWAFRLGSISGFRLRTSGVSYCFVDRFGKAEGPPASVPLLAAQAHLQPTILSKQHNVWGTDAKQYDDKLTLLKLALLENELEGEPEHIRAVQQELNKISATGYDAITILADYIGMMWADARSKIQQAVAFRLGGQNVGLKSSLIFSIPAVWSERAAERMQKAIVKSGITVDASFIDLVLEPEAAALAVLPGLSKLKNGKAVVIADLGGGTVDFISYTLSPTTARRFNQCVAAEGRLLGDMFMKSALRSFIAEKVEGKLRIDIASLHQAGFEAQVKKVWRNACAFEKGAEDLREWSCPVVTNRQDGTEMPAVTIDGSDIVATFRSITKGILALTHSQIEAAEERQGSPQGIVVVGGFGLNSFLKEELRINFDKLVNFTDDAGLLAVKNGAAMYGVAKMAGESAANQQDDPVEGSARIDSRMTRRSYGVWAGTGPKDIVHWFISKNQTVGDHHDPIILPLAAFNARIDRDQPCAPIYSCGRKVTGLRSITSDIKVYKNPYQIRCLNPRAVDGVESLHLRPWLNDRQEIEFEVQDDLKGFFTVEKLK